MSVKFSVKMKTEYMYDFMLHYNYTHVSGLLGVVIGILALGYGIFGVIGGDVAGAMLWFLFAIFFLVLTPKTMKMRAKSQIEKAEMFQKPLDYELSEAGITVRQDEQQVTNPWASVSKAVSTKKSIIVYMGRVRALIFPKECLGEQYEEAVKMLRANIPAAKVKIK